MCDGSILLPLRLRERNVKGRMGRRDVTSSADSISADLTSMARFR